MQNFLNDLTMIDEVDEYYIYTQIYKTKSKILERLIFCI